MMAVGLSSSILGCLVTLLVYSYCQRYQQQSHDATVIHPVSAPLNTSITNHINKLDKYDSVEAIKVGASFSFWVLVWLSLSLLLRVRVLGSEVCFFVLWFLILLYFWGIFHFGGGGGFGEEFLQLLAVHL